MPSKYEAFVIGLAAPVVRHQGGDDGVFGGAIAPARALSLLDTLFRIKTAEDANHLLETFAEHGQRAEWTQFDTHAGGGAWNPGPEDHSVLRKATFAIAHRKKLGKRGLLALDAMRSSAIAGWCAQAGLLSSEDALATVTQLVKETAKAHRSWQDFAEQLRLAYQFTDGDVPAEIDSTIQSLLDGEGPWRDTEWPKGQLRATTSRAKKKADDDDDDDDDDVSHDPSRPLSIVSFALSVDCHGCGETVSFPGIVATESCRHCRTAVVFEPSDWAYHLKDDFTKLRKGTAGDDPFTNDFGARFFSRREVRAATAIHCACGAELETPSQAGELVCGACGAMSVVHEANEHVAAIDRRARFLVDASRRPLKSSPSFPCAACGSALTLGNADSSVVRCSSCSKLTFVDEATWVSARGHSRRAVTYVLLAWS